MSTPTLANARSAFVLLFQFPERKLAGFFGLKSRAKALLAAQAAMTFPTGELALYPHPSSWQLKSPAQRQGESNSGVVFVNCEDGRLAHFNDFGVISVHAQPLDF